MAEQTIWLNTFTYQYLETQLLNFCTPLFNSYDQKNLTKIILLYGVANNIFAYFLIF